VTFRMAEPAERAAAGGRINPETARVWFLYALTLSPYGDEEVDPGFSQMGREWFAADPFERIAVHFHDLPQATQDALEDKRRQKDREGWEAIARGEIVGI
jgi:hypothetical protein